MKHIVCIDWDVDLDESEESCSMSRTMDELGLPDSCDIPDDVDEETIADYLSDEYSFCVNGYVVEDAN